MPTYRFEGLTPIVHPDAYVDPTAVLIGDCHIARGCYVGPCAVIRADLGRVLLHEGANLQDGCIIHSLPAQETILEPGAHIGHGAVLHGCRIGHGALVGINAVVMDEADVGEEAFVGALSFVRPGMRIPPRSLAAGAPARIIRELSPEEVAHKMEGTRGYQHLAQRYAATAALVEPLRQAEPGRPMLPPIPGMPQPKTR